MPKAKFEILRKCKVCGSVFTAKTIESWYCSPKCSKIAWKRKKDEEKRRSKLEAIAGGVADDAEYISVMEATAIYGLKKATLYRLVRSRKLPSINIGLHMTKIKRSDIEQMFPEVQAQEIIKQEPKLYSLEPKDCYTIGEIARKYHVDESTVASHIRKSSIPTRQIGNYVYAPKSEIDKLYQSL